MLELTKQQTNQIFTIIKQNGLDPALFRWGQLRREFLSETTLFIEVDGKQFHFTFESGEYDLYTTNVRPLLEGHQFLAASSWNVLVSYFAQWLNVVKGELEEPDLWKSPFAQLAASNPKENGETAQFTLGEKEQIKRALKNIQKKLGSNPNFGKKRMEELESRFAYLENKLETTSKFDWKNICLGILIHIYAEPWLAPFAHEFKELVMQGMTPLIGPLLQ